MVYRGGNIHRLVLCCMLGGVLCLQVVAGKSYKGYEVIRTIPETTQQLEYLQSLVARMDYPNSGIDVWQSPGKVNSPMDLTISPRRKASIKKNLARWNLTSSPYIADVEELIERTRARMPNSSSEFLVSARDNLVEFNSVYHTLEEIEWWMDKMAAESSSMVTKFRVGATSEGRAIHGLKVTSPGAEIAKPSVFMIGGIHAREWITTATMIYMLSMMTDSYDTDDDVKQLLDTYDFHIVPVTNPDGYKYTWTNDRLWRKTRSGPHGACRSKKRPSRRCCYGVDPNRNFPFKWGGTGSSSSVCSETFRGPGPLSEPEISGLTQFVANLHKTTGVKMFFDVHSYSQMLFCPWAYTYELPPDYSEMMVGIDLAADAIKSVHGTEFKTGSVANTIYIVSGESNDWAYAEQNIKHSYGLELRDTGKFGFLLPPEQIIPTGEETMAGLMTLIKYVT